MSEVGLIPVQPGLNPVQGGPIVVHPGLDSVLSRVSSTEMLKALEQALVSMVKYLYI